MATEMAEEPIPIANVDLAEDEIQAAVEVLESGYLVQGEQVAEFEAEFADAVGADHAVAVSSGTAALHLAYLAAVPEDSEVLVPALSHISTASMVEFAGATPVFCDVEERRFTLDVEDARERVTDNTAAVTPVHLFGNVAAVPALQDLASAHDLTIIWDAAQAHGSTYEGHDVGSFEDLVTYSFYPTKNMTTAEGGMITTDDADLAETCRRLRAHWQTEKYYHPDVGLNCRMTDVEAAIGRKQLEKLPDFVASRRENAAQLTDGLSSVPGVATPWVPASVAHSYHQYTVLLDLKLLGCSRERFRKTLNEHGIGTAVHYPRALNEQPAFDTDVTLPTAESVSERVLSLPVYPSLTRADVDRIVTAVAETVENLQG